MKTFTSAQLAYLKGEPRLARLATADENGRPHVTPVGMWRYNDESGTVDVTGHNFSATKKYRNVRTNPQTALVVDDIASTDPWHPRALIVEGSATTVSDEQGDLIRITPEKVISWGLEE